MIPLIEIPEIVEHYKPFFASVFSPDGFVQFQRYVSGLIVSENKTVEGINQAFVVDVRNQSSLNRFLAESPFSLPELNQARLSVLQSQPATQIKPRGVLSVDDTLLTHYGKHFEKISYLYDSDQKTYVWAHNLVNLHYSDDETDYPVEFCLWEPADLEELEAGLTAAGIRIQPSKYSLKQQSAKKWRNYLLQLWRRHQHKPEVGKLYQSKLILAERLLARFFAQHKDLKLPVAFDTWYTQPAFCRFLDKTLQVPYVGTLACDDKVVLPSGQTQVDVFADSLRGKHRLALRSGGKPVFAKIRIPYKGNKETYYSYCHTHRIHNFGKLRLVINHREEDLSDPGVVFICNRLNWNAPGITRIRRHRWPVEVYHEEGKEEGLDQYQVRAFQAICRHIALVAVTYSLLKAAQHDKVLLRTLQRNVKLRIDGTLGHFRRNAQAQALWALATFAVTAVAQGQKLHDAMAPILAAVSR